MTYIIFIARWLSCAFRIQGSYLVETITIAAPAPVYAEAFVLVSINYEGMTASSWVRSSIEHGAVGINLLAQSAVPCLSTHIFYCHQMRKFAVAEMLLQGGYQVADIRTASVLIILHLHSHTEVCHQSCHAVESGIVGAVIFGRHACPIVGMLEIGSQGLAVPGIRMASGALGRIAVVLHYDGSSRCYTACYIVAWRILIERNILVPFCGFEQFFACKCCSCGSLVCYIIVAQRRNLPFIALQQILQSVRQILGIK